MTPHDLGWMTVGILLGWLTKIPIFLKHYRDWENERDRIRAWMKRQQDLF